jgi:REP element-mobilizing transposase RayT
MPDPTSVPTDRLALVDRYIREFSSLAAKHCPQAEIEVLSTCFEDEDAHLIVYVPTDFGEDEMDRLSERLTKRSTQVLLDAGILILAGVYEASEKPTSA